MNGEAGRSPHSGLMDNQRVNGEPAYKARANSA